MREISYPTPKYDNLLKNGRCGDQLGNKMAKLHDRPFWPLMILLDRPEAKFTVHGER